MQLWRENGRYAKLIRYIKRVLNKIFEILTFGYYIRSMLEINQFALISSINEIYLFNTSQRYRVVSLVFAFIVLIGCILLIVFVLFLSLINKRQDKEKLNQSEEFFSGLKVLKKSRLYVWILMWRRVVYVLLLITLVSTSSIAIIITLASLQVFYTACIIYLRPYSEFKSNMIEILNEITFFVWISWLIYFNTSSRWSSGPTSAYIWLIVSNNIISFTITSDNNFLIKYSILSSSIYNNK